MVIDGRKIALEVMERLKKEPVPKKFLAAFLVGGDKSSEGFLKQKEKIAKELGVDFRVHKFPENTSEKESKEEISKTVGQKECGGVIVQLPLPAHINRQSILNAIPLEKDVDVLNEKSSGGKILPPAVGVVEEILRTVHYSIQTKKVAVVGLGFLVGKPISEWLKGKCAEIYSLDVGSDLGVLKNADVIVIGVGKAGLIKPGMLKENVLVIDFGYSTDSEEKVRGDFDPTGVSDSIRYTPTPGGTGPILVAKLFENFYKLTNLQK